MQIGRSCVILRLADLYDDVLAGTRQLENQLKSEYGVPETNLQ